MVPTLPSVTLSGTPKLSKAAKIHRQILGTTDWAKHTAHWANNKGNAERKVQKALNQLTKALENVKLHIQKLDFNLDILLEFSNKLIIQYFICCLREKVMKNNVVCDHLKIMTSI